MTTPCRRRRGLFLGSNARVSGRTRWLGGRRHHSSTLLDICVLSTMGWRRRGHHAPRLTLLRRPVPRRRHRRRTTAAAWPSPGRIMRIRRRRRIRIGLIRGSRHFVQVLRRQRLAEVQLLLHLLRLILERVRHLRRWQGRATSSAHLGIWHLVDMLICQGGRHVCHTRGNGMPHSRGHPTHVDTPNVGNRWLPRMSIHRTPHLSTTETIWHTLMLRSSRPRISTGMSTWMRRRETYHRAHRRRRGTRISTAWRLPNPSLRRVSLTLPLWWRLVFRCRFTRSLFSS